MTKLIELVDALNSLTLPGAIGLASVILGALALIAILWDYHP